MTALVVAPDVSGLEIVADAWTEPFWQAAAARRLVAPRCGDCGRFRWPPTPFCPVCRSQRIDWVDPGPAYLYSYTIVSRPDAGESHVHAPALVAFPEADDIRMVAALDGMTVDSLAIGMPLCVEWHDAADGRVPVFRSQTAAETVAKAPE